MHKLILAAAAGAAFLSAAMPANAQLRAEWGWLTCRVNNGAGAVLGSSKTMTCSFRPFNRGAQDNYSGVLNKIGIDVGLTGRGIVQWLVLGPTTAPQGSGALAGSYYGASADASAGIGGGANMLFGWNRSVTLQPLSVQGQAGINAAVAVSGLHLRSM